VLLALLVTGGCATVQQRDQPLVDAIVIEGAQQVPERAVKAKILTSEQPFWFWEDPSYFDANAWQADLRRIERFYEARGYYQAKVLEDEVVAHKDLVRLRVRVEEGEPTRIRQIRIDGLASLSRAQKGRVLDGFPLQEGAIFREDLWVGLKSKVAADLRELGFADAAVKGQVQVDVEERLADVALQIEEGQRYRFGDIFVATDANPKVSPRRIIEQARQAIARDAWYSESALAEAQVRVFKMGVFGGVKVNRGAPDRQTGTVPVIVDVREAPFHTLRAGMGLGLDQSRQEIRAIGEYIDRDFFGGLRTLQTQVRVGWAFLPTVWDYAFDNPAVVERSRPLASLSTEFSQPRIFLPTLSYFAALRGGFRPEQGYEMMSGEAETGLVWAPHPNLTAHLSYNYEAYYFLQGNALQGARTRLLGLRCERLCSLSYLEPRIEWDRRFNHLGRPDGIQPTRGYYLSLSAHFGGGLLGGSFDYLRVMPEARFYQSMLENDRLTFAFRARAGALLSSEESPIVARFYAGGGNSFRGFGNRRLSPLLLVSPTDDVLVSPMGFRYGELLPIGGERLFEGSAETRYRVSDNVALATFLDVGFNTMGERLGNDLTLRGAPDYFRRNAQYAVGVGLRYLTLVGPIRVDLAYRLPFGAAPRVYQYGQTENLLPPPGGGCFGFGNKQGGMLDNPEPRCALHISIGEAF
jgi:translocation and assembly module TamA